MEVDILAALGCYWGEAELRDFAAAFGIKGFPALDPDDVTCFLQNGALGVELTFRAADALKVRLRDYPPGALVLHNIRFYGADSRTHAPFTGALPFGLRFGDTRPTLIEKLGLPDFEVADLGSLRWDRRRYALFVVLGDDGTAARVALQTPVVATDRPGFEER
ncbi:MAG TPA: hypothetical protein VK438_17650 [Xanthobacteraceae bacterium]|nr:hypothetical protein [Xanthobacteraceae bacterium]